MLQVNDRQHLDSQNSAPPEGSSPSELIDFFRLILHREYIVILSIMFLTIALGAAYVLITPPTYTARATMLIERGKVQSQLGGMAREVPLDTQEVESHIQLLKSEAVARAVINKLNLAHDPEFVGPPVGIGGLVNDLISRFTGDDNSRSRGGSPPSTDPDPQGAALATLTGRVTINRIGGSVIEIEFKSLNAERSADIANAFADCYVEDQLNSRYLAARQAVGWLQDRIRELGDQSSLADETVVQFKAKNNIVAAGGRLINDQQLAELNTQLGLAREKTAEARARLDRIETIIRNDRPDNQQLGGTVSDTLNNQVIVKLRSQYLELSARESDLARRLGKDHLAVTNLDRQIKATRASIADELRRIAETYKSEYEIAKQRQAEIEKTVAEAVSKSQEAGQALIELRQLENAAETFRTMHKSALQRNTELVQQESFPGTEARLITRASAPTSKSSPKTLLVMLASAVGGMMLGLGVGVLRASLDNVFRTSVQVEGILQTNCIALAPMVSPAKQSGRPQRSGARTMHQSDVIWEVVDRPLSRFAEAMRSIKSASDLSGESIKVLGFTSALSGEGKSTIAGAYSLLAAQMRSRAILVDCDLRNPALSAALAPGAEHGILEVIAGKKSLEDALWRDSKSNLCFLPGATKSRVAHSSEILASASLRTFFAELRQNYDYVIVDLPPLAPIVDVRSTAGLVDSYVFVIEWARTKVDVAEFALIKAPMVRDKLLGVVLNKVDFKMLRRYEGHRSDYYSDKLYAQYGG
jgi:succinoglycan biosynthesis transport protein ExoP